MTEEEDPAPDVTDLATAKRYIAGLRATLTRVIDEAQPARNELAVFLSDEDMELAVSLFKRGKLSLEQESDPDLEFDEAFGGFVSEWLGVATDMARDSKEEPPPEPFRPKMA